MLITGQIIKIGLSDTREADFRDSVGSFYNFLIFPHNVLIINGLYAAILPIFHILKIE